MTECIMTIQILKDLNGRMHNGYTLVLQGLNYRMHNGYTSFIGSELQGV